MNDVRSNIAAELAAFGQRHANTRLSCGVSSAPPGLAIVVEGDLNTENSLDFQGLVTRALVDAKAAGGLIIDLYQLKYISSTGVGALTSLLIEARGHQSPVFLSRMPERARGVLDVLGFTSFFSFIDGYKESG